MGASDRRSPALMEQQDQSSRIPLRGDEMEQTLMRQVRLLQITTLLLGVCVVLLALNSFHPFLHSQRFKVIDAEQINIREKDGTLKAVLSNSAGFNVGDRAKDAPPRFSGLMFYNEEGDEE